jgi:hypothetical protein
MSIIFDPTKMLKKVAPEAKVKRMVTGNFSVKRTILATIGSKEFPVDKASIGKVARKTLLGYKERVAKAVVDAGFEKAAGTEEKQAILGDPKQLVQRVQNEVVFQVHQGIKDKYAGQRARWLPSDADEPRPEHQANYGKTYIIGEGIDGVEPGDEYGCKCGVEILTDETQLDLS